jgi:ribosomal protein L37AE/L43A
MSLRLQGTTRNGRPVTKECPICGARMVRDDLAESETIWECTNDDCGHRESP